MEEYFVPGVNKQAVKHRLSKNTCRYWLVLSAQIDGITWRKTQPVTTTIILIRPLHRAAVSHMLLPGAWSE